MTEQKKSVQEQFGANAEKYARSTLFAQGESLTEMIKIVSPQPEWEVLDVATGGGHCAFTVAPLVRHVVATDITQPMLTAAARVAQERWLTNISFEPADAEALPYADNRFDLVTCRIAAHHFADIGRAVREMARVCKPGGLVAIIDGIAPPDKEAADEINTWEIMRDPSHVALQSIDGWSALFRAASLETTHIGAFMMELDFNEHMRRAGCDGPTIEKVRARLLYGSQGMHEWLKPRIAGDKIEFSWRLILIVGRKSGV